MAKEKIFYKYKPQLKFADELLSEDQLDKVAGGCTDIKYQADMKTVMIGKERIGIVT